MDTDQVMFVEEKEAKESSEIQRERCVFEKKVKLSPFQSKHMGNVGFIGVRKGKMGKFGARIRDPITKKRIWLGTFNTAEEASKAYLLKKKFLATFQSVNKPFKGFSFSMDVNKGKEPISCVESSCLMASVHGTKSSRRCFYTVTNHPKARRSLLGIRRRKNGWDANVARVLVRCKKVWLTTSETKSCDQIEPDSPDGSSLLSVDSDQTVYAASVVTRNKTTASHETTHFVGVRKRTSGRFSSDIRNPISKKRIWLGTFETAEEASQAYQSKKLEFQKLTEAKQQCYRQTHSSVRVEQDGNEKLVNAKQRHETATCEGFQPESYRGASYNVTSVGGNKTIASQETTHFIGVRKTSSGRFSSRIRNPISKKEICLGTFDTAEEASQAYQSKKLEFQKLVEVKQQRVNKIHSSARADQDGKEKLVKVNSRKEPIVCAESSKEASSFVSNIHGTESSDGCIYSTVTSNPEAKRHLLRIRRQNDGRYAARIADPFRHEKVWLDTSDAVVEDPEAYFSKKSEYEKLSKGNKENKTKNCDQTQPESPVGPPLSIDEDQTLSIAFLGTENYRLDSHRTHIIGAHKRKSGRYTSEIRNPITKERIWLGSFVTAEEASQAYLSKKLEFQKLVEVKQQHNGQTHSSAGAKQDGKEKLVNVKQGQETVNHEGFRPESSCGASGSLGIEVPMSNSSNGGSDQRIESHEISHSLEVQTRKSGICTSEILLGTLGTAEEALNAYQCKKPDFERSKKAELQDTVPTDSSAGKNRKGQEDEDLWMGQWVKLPGNREIKFSLKLGVPIIDNYGCLLGEFSSLDDLRIC